MAESADKIFASSVKKYTRRGSTSWVHPAPHTNDPHIVKRILSPTSKMRNAQPVSSSTYNAGESSEGNYDPSPLSDFLIKGKSTFICPVRIYPVNGSFVRSDDDAGIVTVSHDKRKIYCPTEGMKEVTSFEFDDISDRTTTNAEFFDSSIAPSLDVVWQGGRSTIVLCGNAKRGSDKMAEGDFNKANPVGFVHMASANFFSRKAKVLQRTDIDSEDVSSYYPIRISWYEIRGHKIVDLLAAASAMNTPAKKKAYANKEELILHEGNGKFIEVSDLLEVEVTCAGDVRKVVNSVRERLKRRRKNVHSVFNISVGTVDGLLTIATLGSMKTAEGHKSTWVNDLQQTLETLRAKSLKSRIAKNHFRSNTMLLLRDGLTRRTDLTFIPCITGDIDDAEETLATLNLGSDVRETINNNYNSSSKMTSSPRSSRNNRTRSKTNNMFNPSAKKSSPFRTNSNTKSSSRRRNNRNSSAKKTSSYYTTPNNNGNRNNNSNINNDNNNNSGLYRDISPSSIPLTNSTGKKKTASAIVANRQKDNFTLESLAESPLHEDVEDGGRTSPLDYVGDEDLSPASLDEILDIVEEKLGGSSRKWVKGSIAALKKARADIVFLQEENEILRNINEEGENTKSTHGKRVQTLKKKLKEKINELKEYELYKDVMESAVQKQSNEMRKLVADQERLEGRFKKERLNAKRQIAQLKKKVANTSARDKADKIQVEGTADRFAKQITTLKRKLKERDDMIINLKQTVAASEKESKMLITRLGAREKEIENFEMEYEKVVRQRDLLLEQIKKVQLTFSNPQQLQRQQRRSPMSEKGSAMKKNMVSSPPPKTYSRRSPGPIPPPPATPSSVTLPKPAAVAFKASDRKRNNNNKNNNNAARSNRKNTRNGTANSPKRSSTKNTVGKQHSPTPQKQIQRKTPQRNPANKASAVNGGAGGTPKHRTRASPKPVEKPNLPHEGNIHAIFKDAGESINRAKDVVASVRARRGVGHGSSSKTTSSISRTNRMMTTGTRNNKFVIKSKNSLRRGRKKKVIQ